VAYFEYLDRWRSSGDFAGLEFRSAESVALAAEKSVG